MSGPRVTARQADVVAGAAFVALAVLVLSQSVPLGAGWDDSGPRAGFFPSALAVLLGIGGLAAAVLAVRGGDRRPFFEDRQEPLDLLAVGIPAALAIASVPFIGFYVMTTLYIGVFAAWYGGYRWYLTLPGGALAAIVFYLGLERGFRILLPKSPWYPTWPF